MMNMRRHDIASQWCRFPRGKCTCSRQTIEYTRLQERLEEGWGEASCSDDDRDVSSDRAEELVFYNDDGSFQSVVVETNLCANDLCQLLAMKNRVPKSVHWSIVEYWVDLGVERLLEDHEYVLSAYRDMRNFSYHTQFKFVFRKDYRKYEFFQDPLKFFPSGMLDVESDSDDNMNRSYLQNLISQEGQCPIIFSYVWVRDEHKKTWSKTYMILRDKKLFTSQKVASLAKFFRSPKNKAIAMISEDKELGNDVRVFAKLSNYHVYTTLNAKNQFRAPTEWGICLRPSGDNTDDETSDQLCCLACDSERVRTCWITAMRLAKYGKQLRENYRAFRNKQAETINPKDYNSYSVPNVQLIRSKPLNGPMFKLGTYESVRSRVAMDFTGAVGRIVEDPQEANAIAIAEGYSWKRRWRPSTRLSGPSAAALTSAHIQTLEAGVHITQPWFHSGMTRDQATALMNRYGTCDGVFLVRESRSNPGSFVLTYKCGSKVLHAQISPILDPLADRPVYSLDSGVTKFYDILQLIEFYQLNAGCLPTRLTHYIVQNGNTVVVPTPVVAAQKAEQDQQANTSSSRNSSSGGASN
ncbi:growth factor receptor-bound protein 14 isoform X2 [Anoplophora glabripennis]|uniref:growth factor receptor-bound protein 14 isoform X2 n=1 Tax=Anoplophora glabripennis TaxID=217634 RepID=UPI0008738FE9|nr:growth factor receptor-bound protein 14 isoform X2 [Anoplophora glabripennis]